MSINVTVTGNPVAVRRGQMFMSEIDNFKKKETLRRRKARLEQVRQQSKDLASNLREKNKIHTSNLLSNLEKQQAQTIQKLTAKKLLNLHQQYDECLGNIGEAHRLAAEEGSPSRYLDKKRKQNFKKCNERGKKALKKLHEDIQSNEELTQKSKNRKLLNRNIENVRSGMITQLNKSKTPGKKAKKKDKKKKHQKMNESDCENRENSYHENVNMDTYRIPDKIDSEENIFSRIAAGDHLSQTDLSRRRICSDRVESVKPLESTRVISDRIESSRPFESSRPYETSRPLSTNRIEEDYNRLVKSSRPNYVPESNVRISSLPEPDTRLSQLIQSRKQRQSSKSATEMEFQVNNNEYNPSDYKSTSLPTKDYSSKPSPPVSRPVIPTPCENPEVPLLEVTDVTDESLNTQNTITKPPKPVQLYDHKTRFTQQYIPKSDIVRKTFADKGVVFPSEEEKLALCRLERQRQFEAKRRGREALERERIKRDHDQLLSELANIRKGEQIVNTYTRNKDGHLSEARLRDKNTKHQLNIEAAFESIYKPPEAQLITTEPVRQPPTKIKFINLPESPEEVNVNVGKWETIGPSTSRQPKVDTTVWGDSTSQVGTDRLTGGETDTLRNLLERVSTQRKLLRRELANFQSSATVPESKSVSVQSEETKTSNKPKRKIIKKSSESIRSSLKTKPTEVSTKAKKSESRESTKSRTSGSEQSTRISSEHSDKNEESNQTLDKIPTKQSTEELIAEKEKIIDLRAAAGGSATALQNLPSEIKILVQKDSEKPVNIKLPDSKNNMKTGDDVGSGIQIIIKLNDNQSAPITTDIEQITSGTNTQSVPTKIAATSPEIKWVSALEKKPEMKESSTSTSYFSPPVLFSVAREDKFPSNKKKIASREKIPEHPIPPQPKIRTTGFRTSDISTPNQKLDDKTKELIQKLLTMSRGSIDRLEVSSSDVCTPDLKVIQTRENLENFLSDADETLLNELFQMTGNSSELKTESERSKSSTLESIASPEPLLQEGYTEVMKFCTQRIGKLTELIDQIRKEQINPFSYNPETTAQTSYLRLPSSPDPSTKEQSGEKQVSSFKDILGVKPVQSNIQSSTEGLLNESYFGIQLRHPLQQTNLQMFQSQSSYETKKDCEDEENGYPTQSSSNSREQHESSATTSSSSGMENGRKVVKKPLPTVVQCSQKYNVDIAGAPAKELSTILEDTSRNVETLAQNLQATKIDDQEEHKTSSSSETSEEQHVSIDPQSASYLNQFHSIPDVSQSTSSKVFMELSSTNNVLQSLDSKLGVSQISNNSSSSDSLDEALKQLGLGWAITTLRKTQQTMQLSSSSSSNSSKNVSKRKPNLSDTNVSLKDLLRQQHKRQLLQTTIESSSTSIESFEISPTIKKLLEYLPSTSKLPEQILKEFNKPDEPGGRTSTPVNLKRNSVPDFIMNQSDDISLIKKPNSLDSFLSLTMPDCSLDVSKTMQRSVSS
ncbi:uncharacterized protein LOC123294290 [Chrysoperla carnea]|uniref:uncharacterized protein LOC123294290 n=1 Tax=Chrysoperla carnea TaxID=189513 RepID=UPI001D065E47|nr:uncharacterized protein LOC123294290 [Chrysoperla carnea]